MYNLLLFDVPQTFIAFLTKDMDEHHGTHQCDRAARVGEVANDNQ